ncbi:MAG: hypothetical protein U0869_01540 [Chloroflexota bacterium]
MNRSVLLRLLPTSRTGPRLAGTAEIVATGERRSFRDADDLVALLQRLEADQPDGSETDAAAPRVDLPAIPHP